MEKLQFRILYRQFLFRMVDLELLSTDARGDSDKLLGQFASLLVFISIGLTIPSLAFGGRQTPQMLLALSWAMEHFLIATTMLVVGLFAVLSWDSAYPDRRDVMVLAPLPVRPRTLFAAKVAAAATALAMTVALLHCLAGLAWPLALTGIPAQVAPALTSQPAIPQVSAASMPSVLNRDLADARRPGGLLAGLGIAIGVYRRGERRVMAYEPAGADSIFEIASLSKTFTAVVLARMAMEGKVRLDEPLRELLPPDTVARPSGREINLLDLASHRSGLPRGSARANGDPDRDYTPAELFDFLGRHGVWNQRQPWEYSNLGFAALGQALANRAGVPYAELLRQEVTFPLGLKDTDVALNEEQARRMIQGYAPGGGAISPWVFDAQAPSGGIRSTAGDMIAYLEAQLHPEPFPTPLAAAIRQTHAVQAGVELPIASEPGFRQALAWMRGDRTGMYFDGGAARGQTCFAFFQPAGDYAAVVLLNVGAGPIDLPQMLAEHIRQRFAGEPAQSLASIAIPRSGGFLGLPRVFAAYWITILAGGAFIFGCLLGLQGLAAQVLPRRLFLRVSPWLQMGSLCLMLGVYLLQPMFASQISLLEAQGSGLLSWSPSYWFLGLFQQLNGSPAFAVLARRASLGLTVVAIAVAVAYGLSYLRTLRTIVEEPDLAPGMAGMGRLPAFGGERRTAIAQFAVRTLMRSRLHRVLLAFYLGAGFAITIFLLNAPATREMMAGVPDPWRRVNVPMLASSIVMLCFWVMGTRVVFAMPVDLRANWVFRITPVEGGSEVVSARRGAMLALAVAPVWFGSAALFCTMWPWRAAAGHLLVLGLLGAILVELSLAGAHKIPFACSYLPGKSEVHLRLWFCIAVLTQLLNRTSELFRDALQRFTTYAILAGLLALIYLALRWRTASSAEHAIHFEDSETPAVQQLGLYRDGILPLEPGAGAPMIN